MIRQGVISHPVFSVFIFSRILDFCFRGVLSSNFYFSGLILVLPCTDTFIKVDLRTVTCRIPPQEVISLAAI